MFRTIISSIVACFAASALYAQNSQVNDAMREFIDKSGGMRICQQGESPVVLVEGKRVQVCRPMTIQDMVNFGQLLQSVTPPRPSQEQLANGKLCIATYERNDLLRAKEFCGKASRAGVGSASLIMATIADESGTPDEALEFYSLASDQGNEYASLIAGVKHAEGGDWVTATKHLHRCYQPSVNGDAYNPNPYIPKSEAKFECTNAVLKLILAGKLEAGPFYEKVAIVPASIRTEIPIEAYQRYLAGYRWYQGNWDAYKDAKLSGLRGSGRVDYRLWMVKDKPVICQFRTGKGKLLEGEAEAAMCRHFQVNYEYNSALSADGNPVSSILEGSIAIDFPRTN